MTEPDDLAKMGKLASGVLRLRTAAAEAMFTISTDFITNRWSPFPILTRRSTGLSGWMEDTASSAMALAAAALNFAELLLNSILISPSLRSATNLECARKKSVVAESNSDQCPPVARFHMSRNPSRSATAQYPS